MFTFNPIFALKNIRRALSLISLLIAQTLVSGDVHADTFTPGDFVTYGQTNWSQNANAATLLQAHFSNVYASSGGTLQVGVGFAIFFNSAGAVHAYLPSSGVPQALNGDLVDPTSTSAGVYGGDVTALAIDVDFSAMGLLTRPSGTAFGDLLLTGFTGSVAGLNGQSVSQLLALAQTELGGGTATYAFADLDPIVASTSGAFDGGTVSAFGTAHLEYPAVVQSVPGPIVGAGLPGLIVASGGLIGWLRRRKGAKTIAG